MAEVSVERSRKELLNRVVNDVNEARNSEARRKFMEDRDDRYRAWRGHMAKTSDAAAWTSKLAPPYLLSVVDAVIANLVDDMFKFTVTPAPLMAAPEDLANLVAGARANEILLRQQVHNDHLEAKFDAFALQVAVVGLTVGKCRWDRQQSLRTSLVMQNREVRNHDGEVVEYGFGPWRKPVRAPQPTEIQEVRVTKNDPTFDVRDVRDFFWPASATAPETAAWLADRIYMPLSDMYEAQCETNKGKWHDGPCTNGYLHNVDDILRESNTSGPKDQQDARSEQRQGEDRSKGMIEVLEYWDRRTRRFATVANGQVLLNDSPWPSGYDDFPYVLCATTPDLFSITGISVVERAMHLQEAIWSLMNQRIDNVKLLNNAVAMFREDMIDDPEEIDIYPGATIEVKNGPVDEAIKIWSPNPISTQISLPAEANLRGDMQNVTSGGPFMSGADTATVDQKTATGVSIITSLAQRIVGKQKRRLALAQQELGQKWLRLNQIYIRGERLVRTVGADGAEAFEVVTDMILQGDYQFEVAASSDSLVRAEKRAEKQALFQNAVQSAPIMAAVGTPWNLGEFGRDLLEAYDMPNPERFFSAQPQAAAPAGGGQPGQEAPPDGTAPGGVTAPQSIDPAVSPSTQTSLSPETFMQRAGARFGRGRS